MADKQEYQDKTLECVDCGATFTFTKGQQRFFANKQLSPPKRCADCREKRKRSLVPDSETKH